MPVAGSERELIGLGPFQVEMRRVLPGHPDTAVKLHAFLRSAYGDVSAVRRRHVRRDGRIEVAVRRVDRLRVVRQLSEAAAVDPAHAFRRMTRGRADAGRPVPAWEDVPTRTVSRRERVLDALPAEIAPTGDRGIRLDDVAAGDATLDAFVAQLSDDELALLARGDITMHSPLGTAGNAGVLGGVSAGLRERGVRPVTTTDGPSGLRLAAYASLLPSGTALASTWNAPLVRELAALHGQEMVRKGSDVLLSPGMNIHRDPLCGRNFEYYSEDPLVTGRMGAAGLAAAKALACGGLALLGVARPAWRNRQIMRAALHVGAAAHLGGARQIEIYGTAPGRSDSALRPGPGGS